MHFELRTRQYLVLCLLLMSHILLGQTSSLKQSAWLVLTEVEDDTYEAGANLSVIYVNKAEGTFRVTADLATLSSPSARIINWQSLPDPTFEIQAKLPAGWQSNLQAGMPLSYEIDANITHNTSIYPSKLFITLYPDSKTKQLSLLSIEWRAQPAQFGWDKVLPQLTKTIEIDWNESKINWE